MSNEINTNLLNFLDTRNERAAKTPISMEEIIKEVEETRNTNYGEM